MSNRNALFRAVGGIEDAYIEEAAPKAKVHPIRRRFSRSCIAVAAAVLLIAAIPLTAFALEIYHYNAAVDYLTSLGIDAKDLSDYSRREVIEAVEVIDAPAGAENDLLNRLLPENSLPPARPTDFTDVTSEQVMLLTPTMTAKDVIELLGDTQDVGSGLFILCYRVDGAYTLNIPFATLHAQLGVTGEQLLQAKQPIEN